MEYGNNNNNHSPFYDLPSGDTKKKASYQGELQIFSESLKRTPTAESRQPVSATQKSAYTPRPKKRKSKYRFRTNENRNVTLTVVMIYAVVGFFVGSLMIVRYSNIISTDEKLDAIEVQIDEMNAKAEELRLQVSLQDDIGMVQKEAKNRLGMYYPGNDQIVYVQLDEEDETNTDNEVMQGDANVQ